MARTTKIKTEATIARESIAEKITKIMAKAASTTSADEAAAFMAKAHQMMEAHQLSFVDLAELDKEDQVALERGALTYWKSENWVGTMAYNLALYYGLSAVRSTQGNQHSLLVVGRESARETFKAMAPWLKKEVHRLSRELAKNGGKTASVYSCEIGKALASRLSQMKAENEAAEAARMEKEPTGFALVPVDAIKAIIEREVGETKKSKGRRTSISAESWDAAQGISLVGQMGQDSAALAGLLSGE